MADPMVAVSTPGIVRYIVQTARDTSSENGFSGFYPLKTAPIRLIFALKIDTSPVYILSKFYQNCSSKT